MKIILRIFAALFGFFCLLSTVVYLFDPQLEVWPDLSMPLLGVLFLYYAFSGRDFWERLRWLVWHNKGDMGSENGSRYTPAGHLINAVFFAVFYLCPALYILFVSDPSADLAQNTIAIFSLVLILLLVDWYYLYGSNSLPDLAVTFVCGLFIALLTGYGIVSVSGMTFFSVFTFADPAKLYEAGAVFGWFVVGLLVMLMSVLNVCRYVLLAKYNGLKQQVTYF